MGLYTTHMAVPRSLWAVDRSRAWWYAVVRGDYGAGWWKQNLRVDKATFEYICEELRPYIQRQNTVFRDCISVEQRIAITLWRLATNIEYRSISQLFGIGRSTACSVVLETCSALKTLLPRYVFIPSDSGMRANVKAFEEKLGFPQAAGAIDGTHIPILRPAGESAIDYFNRKGFYSIIMQALVDHRGVFMDICVGWPGKVHDARVFSNSTLYQRGQAGTLLPAWTRQIGFIQVPLCILGDPAYPALTWLMKAYPEHQNMTVRQINYNYRLSRARMVVENAFGRLKGRWRCLLKRNDCSADNVITVVCACVVLHNICELFQDECLEEWTVTDRSQLCMRPSTTGQHATSNAPTTAIRNAIAEYLEQH